MSDSSPFEPGATPGAQEHEHSEMDAVLEELTRSLAQTKPWIRLFSILGFLLAAIAIGIFVAGSMIGGQASTLMEVIVMIPVCVLIYLVPSILLWKYANRIGDFVRASNPVSFSVAINAQKSFWKYLGILCLILIVLYGAIFTFAGLFTAFG